MHRRYFGVLLLISGFCGLAYELLWVRLLTLSFGSTTLSFSTVVAVFLGGLALGSYLCGRSPRALANPVRTYAYLEIGTGVLGLILYPVLRHLPELYAAFDPGGGTSGAFVRLAFSVPLLLPPTLLMGATLPVVCAACIHDRERMGPATAVLYGLNTLGACLGTYGATFVLMPALGLDGSVAVTVAANFLVGAAALALEARAVDVRSSAPVSAPTDASADEDAPTPAIGRLCIALAFLGGLSAVAVQVAWSRLFSTYLEGTIYGVGSVLVSVLLGIGIGSLVVSERLVTPLKARRAFIAAQLVLLVSLHAFWSALPLVQYQLQILSGGLTGMTLMHAQLAGVIAALLLPAAASGASIPILARVAEHEISGVPRTVGRLYAANTAGSIIGSISAGFLLLPELGTPGVAFLSTLLVALSVILAGVLFMREQRTAGLGAALGSVVLIAGFPTIEPAQSVFRPGPDGSYWATKRNIEAQKSKIAFFKEGPVASVLVTADAGSAGLSLNGLGQGTWKTEVPHHLFESLLVAQVPIQHTVSAKRALLVGLGAGTTADALLELGVESLTILELEPGVVEALPKIFRGKSPLDSPKTHLLVDDARHHLLVNRARGERFDLIASMPAHPWIAANVFTREFFELAHDNLTPDGVFGTWFGRSRMNDELFLSLFRAFTSVFPNYIVYSVPEAAALYFVGSPSPIRLDPARFAEIQAHPIIAANESRVDSLSFFTSRVMASGSRATPPAKPGPVNTDESCLAETLGPLLGTSTTSLTALVPFPSVLPEMIPEAARLPVLIETLEAMLGTPEGKLPLAPPRADSAAATRLLDAASETLGAEAREYFRARIDLHGAKRADARRALERVANGGGPLSPRAAAFFAVSEDGAERAQRALAELIGRLPTRSDVWARVLETPHAEIAVRAAASSTLAASRDPLGWLIAAGNGAPKPIDDRARLSAALGRFLVNTPLVELAPTCARAATSALPELGGTCRLLTDAARGRKAKIELDAAIRAGRADDFKTALSALERAHQIQPLEPKELVLYLKTAAYLGDAERIARISDELRLRGVPDAVIADRLATARDKIKSDLETPVGAGDLSAPTPME